MSASLRPSGARPVGTGGGMGQLFTVYARNWKCADCSQENMASRTRCIRCRRQKPADTESYVADPALQALQSGTEMQWQEVIDPASRQIYYYNRSSGVTQWERPAEMGAAPVATGWFGRGQAGSDAAQRYSAKNTLYLTRPARKQKDFIDPKKYAMESSAEFNVWYGKNVGDREENNRDPAPDRCVLAEDAGFTKADTSGVNKNKRYFCLHFAHGACAKGAVCSYFHRVPTPDDDARCDELVDCFGRARHAKNRDDMKGTGSFLKPSRTLFVGGLVKTKYPSNDALEEVVWRHFEEWGELENVSVIHRLGIAFPRYRLRTSAEFAKEAMWNQALDAGEVLSLRWAHDDPNPVAQDAISRADKDALLGLMQAQGVNLAPAPFEYPASYDLPAAKRIRTEGEGEGEYPDTDTQYQGQGQGQGQGQMTAEQYQQYCDAHYASYYAAAAAHSEPAPGAGAGAGANSGLIAAAVAQSKQQQQQGDEEDDDEEEDEEEDVWRRYQDTNTQAFYYHNAALGQTVWGRDSLPAGAKVASGGD